mgnify:CR=1 FL=1
MVCFVAKKLSLSKRVLSVNSVNSPKPLFSHVTQRTLLRQIIPPKLILSVSCTNKKIPPCRCLENPGINYAIGTNAARVAESLDPAGVWNRTFNYAIRHNAAKASPSAKF